jgi:4-hydroxy-L-threonine phosphate dehydrogenase PdxA
LFEQNVVDVFDFDNIDLEKLELGKSMGMCGQAMLSYTDKVIELALENKIHAAIGGPHTKKSVELAGIEFSGYPNYIAQLTRSKNAFLMLAASNLRVCNVTLHVPMRTAIELIKKDLILECIAAVNETVKGLGIKEPKIAVAGLNPHAGEEGMFGSEEIEEIEPAINQARTLGINVLGPFAGDSLFYKCLDNKYDAYIGMYHDQGHIALKALAFEQSSGLVIGTPVLFSTVGHGSALDIADKWIAKPGSMIETIKLLSALAKNKKTYKQTI